MRPPEEMPVTSTRPGSTHSRRSTAAIVARSTRSPLRGLSGSGYSQNPRARHDCG
jgi:hypothetical protein